MRLPLTRRAGEVLNIVRNGAERECLSIQRLWRCREAWTEEKRWSCEMRHFVRIYTNNMARTMTARHDEISLTMSLFHNQEPFTNASFALTAILTIQTSRLRDQITRTESKSWYPRLQNIIVESHFNTIVPHVATTPSWSIGQDVNSIKRPAWSLDWSRVQVVLTWRGLLQVQYWRGSCRVNTKCWPWCWCELNWDEGGVGELALPQCKINKQTDARRQRGWEEMVMMWD